jgi:hypothetical protein
MKGSKALFLSLLLGLSPLGNAFSKDKVTMASEVPFERALSVPNNIRVECNLNNKLHDYIQSQLEMNDVEVVSVEDIAKAKGRVLDVTISDARGWGGSGWSGPKFMELSGTLKENGKKTGSFTAGDHSIGGGFSGFVFKGTCYIFDVIAQELAKDIGVWYANGHAVGARLGK